MQALRKELRDTLERTIKKARDVAEEAARAALNTLGVAQLTAHSHSSEAERELRRRLRAHGRQLGDRLNGDKPQTMERLVEEVAYEHWHRMLFARFLAENDLLMDGDPETPTALTLEECDELAAEQGNGDGWELASRYAARMLPQIFRPDSPVFQLRLAPEHQKKLEQLLAGLDSEVFLASDSLGWGYQFWQAKRKEEINASEVKIGARELPAVTQLFTEAYMVSFLLDNSLGAWWAARRLSESDLKTAPDEETLRRKAALPNVPLDYLRFVRREDGSWTPAAGTFDAWPKNLAELKTLDPCCGSGHFLVAALLMLVPMRMELEQLSAKEAVDAVLRENLHGLELDKRCVELAAFALALTAWRYSEAGGYRSLPELNVACSGLHVHAAKEEWRKLGLGKKNLGIVLAWMHDAFQDASTLGSLLNPAKSSLSYDPSLWKEVVPLLEQALKQEPNEDQYEMAVTAQGLAKAATLLTGRYQWVLTNVPYLTRGKQSKKLRDFCEQHYEVAKNDLATVFLERCLEFCVHGGTISVVLPQNWLFLTTYKKFREKLLKAETWHIIARLGAKAFQTPMWDFNVQLCIMSKGGEIEAESNLLKTNMVKNLIRGIDVSNTRSVDEKAIHLHVNGIEEAEQIKQLENPDARIVLGESTHDKYFSTYCYDSSGCLTSDGERFYRCFWEQIITSDWEFMQSTVSVICHFHGRSLVIFWENAKGTLFQLAEEMKGTNHAVQNWKRGQEVWNQKGVAISSMNRLLTTLYSGYHFDNNTAVIIPCNPSHFPAIWCYCSSPSYHEAVREIDQSLKVTNATLVKVPFDLEHWTQVAAEEYPHGLPEPYSDDPTQWIFHGHPCGSVVWDEKKKRTAHGPLRDDAAVLQTAVARLLGYRWPAEMDTNMELAPQQREWVDLCQTLKKHVDDDGIVCIPAVRGEQSASDRLFQLLADAYGKEWSPNVLNRLLANAGHAGKTLESWLRDKFFEQHYKIFQNRPFIWHIWDGLNDGFSALVNYHKFDKKLLETLIFTYLGDWMTRQKQEITQNVDGAKSRLAAAQSLEKKLKEILIGKSPLDIFVRWKPLKEQPIGWNPDLNDGVRLNIRPFMTVEDVKVKGAGVLRSTPNIKWGKDRGKDVESAPWYHLFEGDRINDHHLTLEEKQNGE